MLTYNPLKGGTFTTVSAMDFVHSKMLYNVIPGDVIGIQNGQHIAVVIHPETYIELAGVDEELSEQSDAFDDAIASKEKLQADNKRLKRQLATAKKKLEKTTEELRDARNRSEILADVIHVAQAHATQAMNGDLDVTGSSSTAIGAKIVGIAESRIREEHAEIYKEAMRRYPRRLFVKRRELAEITGLTAAEIRSLHGVLLEKHHHYRPAYDKEGSYRLYTVASVLTPAEIVAIKACRGVRKSSKRKRDSVKAA